MDNMNIAKKIKLISNAYTCDDIGQFVPTESEKSVFALVRSVSQSEFFNAGENGFKPDKVFDVLVTEYDGQVRVKCDDDIYSIYRSYINDNGRIELYAEKRVGD